MITNLYEIEDLYVLMAGAMTEGVAYIPEYKVCLIPMFTPDNIHIDDAASIIDWDNCEYCDSDITRFTQESIDAIFINYYNEIKGIRYIGFCTKCGNLTDMTEDVNRLL